MVSKSAMDRSTDEMDEEIVVFTHHGREEFCKHGGLESGTCTGRSGQYLELKNMHIQRQSPCVRHTDRSRTQPSRHFKDGDSPMAELCIAESAASRRGGEVLDF